MKWALVLSGGGARGLAHIGVLEILEEMGAPKPSFIAGTSMGAIVGGMYACGMSTQAMRAFVGKKIDILDFMSDAAYNHPGLPVGKFFKIGNGITNLFSAPGIDTGEKMEELIVSLTDGINIQETAIPFACNATDLCTGEEVVFSAGPMARAIRASSSFPGIFCPLADNGRMLADGYLCHNLPVWIARRAGYRAILALDTGAFADMEGPQLRTAVDVLMRSFDCAVHRQKRTGTDRARLTLDLQNDRWPFDFRDPQDQIDFGRETAQKRERDLCRFFRLPYRTTR